MPVGKNQKKKTPKAKGSKAGKLGYSASNRTASSKRRIEALDQDINDFTETK